MPEANGHNVVRTSIFESPLKDLPRIDTPVEKLFHIDPPRTHDEFAKRAFVAHLKKAKAAGSSGIEAAAAELEKARNAAKQAIEAKKRAEQARKEAEAAAARAEKELEEAKRQMEEAKQKARQAKQAKHRDDEPRDWISEFGMYGSTRDTDLAYGMEGSEASEEDYEQTDEGPPSSSMDALVGDGRQSESPDHQDTSAKK